jgi:hypothetical protein
MFRTSILRHYQCLAVSIKHPDIDQTAYMDGTYSIFIIWTVRTVSSLYGRYVQYLHYMDGTYSTFITLRDMTLHFLNIFNVMFHNFILLLLLLLLLLLTAIVLSPGDTGYFTCVQL